MQVRIFAGAMLGIVATLVLGVSPLAQTSTPSDPIIIYTQERNAFARGGLAEQLQQRAREKGGLRVIVGLRIVTRMEYRLTADQAAEQRRRQRAVEDAVLRRVLRTTLAPRVIRFEFIPYVSMYVNAEQVGRLLADPQVASLHEDVPMRPALDNSTTLIHAPELWKQRVKGTDQVVAVLDSGVAARDEGPRLRS